MTYDSIIFDLDGTLWNTVSLCTKAWNDSFARLKLPPKNYTDTDIGKLMGQTAEQIATGFLGEFPLAKATEILDVCFAAEIENIRNAPAPLYPGVKEGIPKLAEDRPLFVVSNCSLVYLDTFLTKSGLETYFKDVECHGRTGKSKGENLLDVITRSRLSRPLFVGDTESDQKAAEHAGCNFAWAKYGFGSTSKFQYVAGKFEELVQGILDAKWRRVYPAK